MATTPSIPKERDEVLRRMTPYLRAHLRKMYERSAASGLAQYTFAAMLLDNIALDDFRSENAKTLNRQAPIEAPTRAGFHHDSPRGARSRTQLTKVEREAIADLVARGKILAKSPAAIAALMAEKEP
jgi:hypothetical protein